MALLLIRSCGACCAWFNYRLFHTLHGTEAQSASTHVQVFVQKTAHLLNVTCELYVGLFTFWTQVQALSTHACVSVKECILVHSYSSVFWCLGTHTALIYHYMWNTVHVYSSTICVNRCIDYTLVECNMWTFLNTIEWFDHRNNVWAGPALRKFPYPKIRTYTKTTLQTWLILISEQLEFPHFRTCFCFAGQWPPFLDRNHGEREVWERLDKPESRGDQTNQFFPLSLFCWFAAAILGRNRDRGWDHELGMFP